MLLYFLTRDRKIEKDVIHSFHICFTLSTAPPPAQEFLIHCSNSNVIQHLYLSVNNCLSLLACLSGTLPLDTAEEVAQDVQMHCCQVRLARCPDGGFSFTYLAPLCTVGGVGLTICFNDIGRSRSFFVK